MSEQGLTEGGGMTYEPSCEAEPAGRTGFAPLDLCLGFVKCKGRRTVLR